MGCERESALEGLSDHLLAMRAVLEGHGPVGASLPMRAAALISTGGELDRIEARERVEDTLELERSTMNGRTIEAAIEIAAWAEEGVRGLLRAAALGELGNDLGAVADETLIVAGLAEGDAEITVSADDTNLPAEDSPGTPGREAEDVPVDSWSPAADSDRNLIPSEAAAGPAADLQGAEEQMEEDYDVDQDTRIMEPIPAEDEIKITATPWLDEVSDARSGDSLEWPADGDRDIQHRERIDTPRVRHLFPVPDSDWDVSHLEFEYSRRTS
jgi:hypothetical protein